MLPLPHQTCVSSLRLGCVVNVAHPLIRKCHRTPSSPGSSASICLPRSTHILLLHKIVSSSAGPLQRKTWTADFARPPCARGPGGPHSSGCAGVFLGEARYPGPVEHERDHTLEPHARRARLNDAGDAVPGSQDFTARRVQHLHSKEHAVTPAVAGFRSVFFFFFSIFPCFSFFHVYFFFIFFVFCILCLGCSLHCVLCCLISWATHGLPADRAPVYRGCPCRPLIPRQDGIRDKAPTLWLLL